MARATCARPSARCSGPGGYRVTTDTATALRTDGLVVPGVGAFAACMAGLQAAGGDQVIAKRLAGARPVLGICVGMQVLSRPARSMASGPKGAAGGRGPCTGSAPRCSRIWAGTWSSVAPPSPACSPASMTDAMFYFVHSYAATQPLARAGDRSHPARAGPPTARTSSRWWKTAPSTATQFHPESRPMPEPSLLANWLETLR